MIAHSGRPLETPRVARYSPFGGKLSRTQRTASVVALLAGGGLVYLYSRYLQSGDVSPDSVYGYAFAISGTLLLLLVGVGYAIRKRVRRHWARTLHTLLAWHMVGGILGLALILMHAAGNYNSRTGTYALCGLIALVLSGMLGRLLDRLAPRFAAKAALRALTDDGEERLEVLVGTLGARQTGRPAGPPSAKLHATGTPWDLAYYGLETRPEEIPSLLGHDKTGRAASTRAPLASAGTMTRSGGRRGGAKADMARESAHIQRAIGTERYFLQLIRVWRRVHTVISLITLGLVLWHLEFAATLLLNAR